MTDRYCSSCRIYKPRPGADVRNQYGKVVRWRCTDCHKRALTRSDEIHGAKRQGAIDTKDDGK